MKHLWILFFAMFLSMAAFGTTNCGNEPEQDAGEAIEEAGDAVEEGVEEAGDKVEEGMEEAGDKVEDATD